MTTITESEMLKALERSGYLLENRILSKFLNHHFWAETNHTIFIDSDENKYREIDVMASKLIDSLSINEFESFSLHSHFIVECINNTQPLGLFENLGDRDEPSSDWIFDLLNGDDEVRETISIIIPNLIQDYETESNEELPSKQYCSFMQKKGDHKLDAWMAHHPDDFHKTLIKLVESVKYKLKVNSSRWKGIRPQLGRFEFFIPVIVLQNELVKIYQKSGLEIRKLKYHRLKTPYDEIYNRNISIDIVQEDYFEDYLTFKLGGLLKIFEHLKKSISNKI